MMKIDLLRLLKIIYAIIWTFRNHPFVFGDPKMYGWVQTNEEGGVLGVSCKNPNK